LGTLIAKFLDPLERAANRVHMIEDEHFLFAILVQVGAE
jgi:hypothetical protein